VRRSAHPTDRRTTLVALRAAGRELALAATKELNAEVFEQPGISPRAVGSLVTILTAMRREAGDF
jgi:DNA-binding MarR family transcriptional regulator